MVPLLSGKVSGFSKKNGILEIGLSMARAEVRVVGITDFSALLSGIFYD